MSVPPVRWTTSRRSRASDALNVIGFSTKTCFPASSACRASAWCVGTGVARTTASSSVSSSRSSKLAVGRAAG